MNQADEQGAADRYCHYLANRHYENFTVASRILPHDLRLHLARIYAFCRVTDDLGDESGRAAMARLREWRSQVVQAFAGDTVPVHPVLIALCPTVQRFALPARHFLDLIDANIRDQEITAYEAWPELEAYCMLSAAPVGRMVLRVFRVEAGRADRLSDDVCIGLQLANFAQDVCLDALKGRTYLLQSDLRREGEAGAVRSMCDRASTLLNSGIELEDMVPGRLRFQLALYRLGGEAILSSIARLEYRTALQRPTVTATDKLRVLARALWHSQGRRTHAPTHRLA